MRTENIHVRNFGITFITLIVCLAVGCDSEKVESERERVIRLLAGDSYKHWSVAEVLQNGVEQTINSCDSSYILTMKTNFKWEELHLRLQCPGQSEGSWELNEDNTVITIEYVNQQSGNRVEKRFKIMDLTEELFAYEVVVGNNLKIIRLKEA